MSTFAIFTYQFERIIRSGNNQLEIDGFPSPGCTDEEWENRLITFRTFFKKGVPLNERTFTIGKSTYVFDTIFIEGNTAIMKFGRLSKKSVTDAQLNDHKIEDYPWCYVVWDNRDGIQRMLVEQKPSAWPNSKTITGTKKVAKALKKIFDEWLSKNIFVFEDENGDAPELPDDLKKFIDDNNITYYSQKEMNEVISKHRAEIGLTDKVASNEYPEWILLYDQTAEFNEEIEKQYIGEYVDDLNDPNLQIAKGEDGKFIIQIGIYRLCFLDDGVGEFQDDKMVFTISDDNGNPMEGYLIVTEDGEATVTFTKSEWDYIEDGDTYTYTKSSDTPNIFVYEFDFDN